MPMKHAQFMKIANKTWESCQRLPSEVPMNKGQQPAAANYSPMLMRRQRPEINKQE